jgi:hypothetical protein
VQQAPRHGRTVTLSILKILHGDPDFERTVAESARRLGPVERPALLTREDEMETIRSTKRTAGQQSMLR